MLRWEMLIVLANALIRSSFTHACHQEWNGNYPSKHWARFSAGSRHQLNRFRRGIFSAFGRLLEIFVDLHICDCMLLSDQVLGLWVDITALLPRIGKKTPSTHSRKRGRFLARKLNNVVNGCNGDRQSFMDTGCASMHLTILNRLDVS
jgi:hypothetical protein